MMHFEDFTVGLSRKGGAAPVSREAIIAFATEFDPQPFHLDEAAGAASLLGGLAASGWQTSALMMRLICDELLLDASSMGSPGVEELRWSKPVRAGDTLTLVWTVLETRASKSRPDMGLVKFRFELLNQKGEQVLWMQNVVMLGRKVTA
jgi:acyl dehydratase